MHFWSKLLVLSGLCLFFQFGIGQTTPENLATKEKSEKIPIRGSERFDFMLSRNFLLPLDPDMQDTVPMDPTRSGTYMAGVSFNFPIGSVLALKLEPRATWNKLYFNPIGAKVFPTDSNATYDWEKHRMYYLEAAAGVKFNLLRNKDERVRLFLELGGFFGYNLSNVSKRRSESGGVKYTEKFHSVADINKLRYGGYVRFGTNWVALNFQYRLSPVYQTNAMYKHPDRNGVFVKYPVPGNIELGVVILL